MRTAATLVVWIVASVPVFGADPGTAVPLSPLFDGKSFAGWGRDCHAASGGGVVERVLFALDPVFDEVVPLTV